MAWGRLHVNWDFRGHHPWLWSLCLQSTWNGVFAKEAAKFGMWGKYRLQRHRAGSCFENESYESVGRKHSGLTPEDSLESRTHGLPLHGKNYSEEQLVLLFSFYKPC